MTGAPLSRAYIWSEDQAVHELLNNCYLKKFELGSIQNLSSGDELMKALLKDYQTSLPTNAFIIIEESVATKDIIIFLEKIYANVKFKKIPCLYMSEANSHKKLPPTTAKILKHLDRNENISMHLQRLLHIVAIEEDVNYEKTQTLTYSQKESRILVAEDQENILKIIANVYLPQLGFRHIQTARDGAEALIKLRHFKEIGEPIDLVIADWEMPKVSGLELYQAIVKNKLLSPKRFILLTAHNHLDDVKEAISAGISSFVTKPFEPEVILNKLVKVL